MMSTAPTRDSTTAPARLMLRFSASTVTSRSSTESNDDNCEVILTPWDAKDRLAPWKCPLYASPRGYVTSAITRYSAVISRTCGYLRRSPPLATGCEDRKSTRLNSSHLVISYAVFCLKKKKHAYMRI